MSDKVEKIICNLIGTLEILDVALEQNDHVNIYKAKQKMKEQIKELKEHEHFSRTDGVHYN